MKVIKDTQDMTDPNEFGETLREYCFINDEYADKFFGGKQYGCYSTFRLRPEFWLLLPGDVYYDRLKRLSGYGDFYDKVKFYCYTNQREGLDLPIFIGWWWDGDGTLIIKEGHQIAVNDDCKCDYTWEWCNNESV